MIRREELAVDGRAAHVWSGGQGPPLLLLHGAWGGAEMHWAPVWDTLATKCRVIAPDFPGLAYESSWVPASFDEAAGWVEGVLDASASSAAWIVGNSFGAAIASRVASLSPERCLGLVLVDGAPAPSLPAFARSLMRRWPLRQLMEGILRRSAYGPSTLPRAFADPRRAPQEIRDLLAQRCPRQVVLTTAIVLGDNAPVAPPQGPTLVLWGAQDRLRGSTVKTARRLQSSLSEAQVVVIPDAGHLPQVEQPDRFCHALLNFVQGSE